MELFDFSDAPAPAPFVEPIHGLHVREIDGATWTLRKPNTFLTRDGADVFSHFFGPAATSH